jgi:hypothetical protein
MHAPRRDDGGHSHCELHFVVGRHHQHRRRRWRRWRWRVRWLLLLNMLGRRCQSVGSLRGELARDRGALVELGGRGTEGAWRM